ncbi:hypothetical protein HMPREF2531_00692 [Bacteroides intestinalis]|uniref:Uncharacterized protein n=1 Tax=Bacteroides intestinalis TaxID=329854 RepID=A0A139LSS5_9BACE|nr:hypothetical protein HMPREF2531_00692 [Bacteroides intestinalis]
MDFLCSVKGRNTEEEYYYFYLGTNYPQIKTIAETSQRTH